MRITYAVGRTQWIKRPRLIGIVNKFTVATRAVSKCIDRCILDAGAQKYSIKFSKWHTEADIAALGNDAIIDVIQVQRRSGCAQKYFRRFADTIFCEIRIGVLYRNGSENTTCIEANTNIVTRAKCICLIDRTRQR